MTKTRTAGDTTVCVFESSLSHRGEREDGDEGVKSSVKLTHTHTLYPGHLLSITVFRDQPHKEQQN